MSFFSQKIKPFGLDFSDKSLKLVLLKKNRKNIGLSVFGEASMPAGVIESGEVKDTDTLSKHIREAMLNAKGGKLRTKYVVCSLPEEKSFVDVLELPLLKEEEYATAVRFEAENHLPLPLSEVYFDFEKIKNGSNPKQQEFLIVATAKVIIEGYLSALKKAGLQVVAMELECLAIIRALINKDLQAESFLIIDIGETRTSFIIFSHKAIRFTSSIPICSRVMTEIIVQKSGLNIEQAEKLKCEEGLTGSKMVSDALAPLLKDLVSQIKAHSEYFSHTAKRLKTINGSLGRILLCGGGANLKGLINFLTKSLQVKVETANPWINILGKIPKEVPILPFDDSLGYTTALGLALRDI